MDDEQGITSVDFCTIHEFINIIDRTDKVKRELREYVNLLQENGEAPLGFIASNIKCEKCGDVQGVIYAVGTRFPCKCSECNEEEACYVSELVDD